MPSHMLSCSPLQKSIAYKLLCLSIHTPILQRNTPTELYVQSANLVSIYLTQSRQAGRHLFVRSAGAGHPTPRTAVKYEECETACTHTDHFVKSMKAAIDRLHAWPWFPGCQFPRQWNEWRLSTSNLPVSPGATTPAVCGMNQRVSFVVLS